MAGSPTCTVSFPIPSCCVTREPNLHCVILEPILLCDIFSEWPLCLLARHNHASGEDQEQLDAWHIGALSTYSAWYIPIWWNAAGERRRAKVYATGGGIFAKFTSRAGKQATRRVLFIDTANFLIFQCGVRMR